MLKIFYLVLIGVFISSCSMYQNHSHLTENKFFNSEQVVVVMAFKANIYLQPGKYDKQLIVTRVNKDDLVTAIGFEKGYIKVLANGKTGFISEQYFKHSLFFDAWKEQELLSMKM